MEIPPGTRAYWEMAKILAKSNSIKEYDELSSSMKPKIMKLFMSGEENWDGHQHGLVDEWEQNARVALTMKFHIHSTPIVSPLSK